MTARMSHKYYDASRLQLRAILIVGALLIFSQGDSLARIVPDPNNHNPNFVAAVNAAITAWQTTIECRGNPLLRHLLDVAQSTHWYIIVKETDGLSACTYDDPAADRDPRNPQLGAPSICYWNWTTRSFYPGTIPPVQRDPTALFVHEVAHAAQAAEGTLPDATIGPQGVLLRLPNNRVGPSSKTCTVVLITY